MPVPSCLLEQLTWSGCLPSPHQTLSVVSLAGGHFTFLIPTSGVSTVLFVSHGRPTNRPTVLNYRNSSFRWVAVVPPGDSAAPVVSAQQHYIRNCLTHWISGWNSSRCTSEISAIFRNFRHRCHWNEYGVRCFAGGGGYSVRAPVRVRTGVALCPVCPVAVAERVQGPQRKWVQCPLLGDFASPAYGAYGNS